MSTYTPTDLAIARADLAHDLAGYRDSGEARAVAADAYTLTRVRAQLEAAGDPQARIAAALALLAAREDWYDSR